MFTCFYSAPPTGPRDCRICWSHRSLFVVDHSTFTHVEAAALSAGPHHPAASSPSPSSSSVSPSSITALKLNVPISDYNKNTRGLRMPLIKDSNAPPTFSKATTTVIFVIGGPGVGKGTQCARLVETYDFVHLSAGELLRTERARPGSVYGELINDCLKEGNIVPMTITISLLEQAMVQSGAHRFLIDGFPRAIDQGVAFEAWVCESSGVLFYDCPESVMLERLLKRSDTSGRVDDNVDSIKKRFETFKETSLPVVDFYRQKGKVCCIPCTGSADQVYHRTKILFDNLLTRGVWTDAVVTSTAQSAPQPNHHHSTHTSPSNNNGSNHKNDNTLPARNGVLQPEH